MLSSHMRRCSGSLDRHSSSSLPSISRLTIGHLHTSGSTCPCARALMCCEPHSHFPLHARRVAMPRRPGLLPQSSQLQAMYICRAPQSQFLFVRLSLLAHLSPASGHAHGGRDRCYVRVSLAGSQVSRAQASRFSVHCTCDCFVLRSRPVLCVLFLICSCVCALCRHRTLLGRCGHLLLPSRQHRTIIRRRFLLISTHDTPIMCCRPLLLSFDLCALTASIAPVGRSCQSFKPGSTCPLNSCEPRTHVYFASVLDGVRAFCLGAPPSS
jgi:hypothetical protein